MRRRLGSRSPRSAASAEMRSEHPLGKAIVNFASAKKRSIREPERFDYVAGRGVGLNRRRVTTLVGNRTLLTDHAIVVPHNFAASAINLRKYSWRATESSRRDRNRRHSRPEARRAIQRARSSRRPQHSAHWRHSPSRRDGRRDLGISDVESDLLPR